MQVSVVIPVFDAAPYVAEAVESALAQPESAEVLLVEDGSRDGSLTVCENLARKHERVVLLRHPNGANRGPGASRNLGIRAARCPFVAFLDADDYYLPGRMATVKRLLEADPAVDGVYEAVEARFESERGRELWKTKRGPARKAVTEPVPSGFLFEALVLTGYLGHVHTNGWIVRRGALERAGLFDEELRLHQDLAMWIKLAGVSHLVAGEQNLPVAVRRVYEANRSLVDRSDADVFETRLRMWLSVWSWGRANLKMRRHQLLMMKVVETAVDPRLLEGKGRVRFLGHIVLVLGRCPRLAAETYFWRQVLRTFSRTSSRSET